jgi:cyclopropane-fatty-acyl-phospholipid synthase
MLNATPSTLTGARQRVMGTIDARAETFVRGLFDPADIRVDGARPEDLLVHDRHAYTRILRDGMLGFGESYMDGQWDCPALDQLTAKLVHAGLAGEYRTTATAAVHALRSRVFNLQNQLRVFEVGERHYDIGNDLYRAMLDRRMAYTCAYFEGTTDLDQAQEAKLDLVCRKVGLRPGMKVLDLGCGFGCFSRYAAEKYGVEAVGFTVSKAQVELGTELCKGLPVELRLDDYRNATGTYDAVVSIGLMEHVGYKNYRTYMELVDRCLAPGGVALIHTIGSNDSEKYISPWFDKYIFPNALLPSLAQLAQASEGLLNIEDVHNLGPHYDPTLMAWNERFERAWPELREKYGERFYRMWRFYLLTSAGSFRSRYTQLYQLVLTRRGAAQPRCRCS